MNKEIGRLQALESYDVLDSPRESDFDEIAKLASEICQTPIAVVNLIGDRRQFFKAEVGLGVRETPIDSSFCAKAILEEDFLLVPDATQDSRFDCNPLVTGEPHLRFYAGALLKTAEGHAIGTVCVLDYQPRDLTDFQQSALRTLARQVMAQLELRKVARSEAAARDAVESERARYEAVFESVIDHAIVVTDIDGLVTDWNEGCRRILGWDDDEVIGRHVSIIFTEEDRASGVPQLEMNTALAVGRGADERWHVRKSGQRFWANGEIVPLRSDDLRPIGFVKILRDRTGPRAAEERLRESEKRWRELFENMTEGFFVGELVRDIDGRAFDYRFIEINPAFSEQSGIPMTAVGTTIRSYARSVPQWLVDRYAHTVETGEPQVFEIEVPELQKWFEIRSIGDEGDRFSCLFFDITPRKDAERRLELADERLKMSLAASGTVGLWDWMLDTDLLHGDANFARMYGLDVDETAAGVTMDRYQTYVVPEDIGPLRASLRDVFENGADFLVEYRLAVPEEDIRWVECRGKLVSDIGGPPTRFSGTAIDITDRKLAADQRQLLLEELAHRVKNTFSVIQAIASQTLKGVDKAVVDSFLERLAALGRAHDLLLQKNWTSTTIHSLLEGVLNIQGEKGRFTFEGPELVLNPAASLSLSLLMHEMATNSVKYGALISNRGRVEVRWSVAEGIFELDWRESGGPPPEPPKRRGFGSKLLSMGINGSRDVLLDYAPTGLTARFRAAASGMFEA